MHRSDRRQTDARKLRLAGRIALLTGLVLAACVSKWPSFEAESYHRSAAVEQAGQPVGAQACLQCHDSFDGHHVSSDQHGYCEACHGPGERHAFTASAEDIRYPSAQDCIACHGTGHVVVAGWDQSEHARAGLLCSSCHDTHDRELWLLRRPDAMDGATLPRASQTTRLCTS